MLLDPAGEVKVQVNQIVIAMNAVPIAGDSLPASVVRESAVLGLGDTPKALECFLI